MQKNRFVITMIYDENIKKISKKFFGYEQEITCTAILTPINRIYYRAKEMIDGREYNGWWKSKYGKIDNKECFISKIPEGIRIIDPVLSLKNTKFILFAGFCGGVSDYLKIGDVVSPVSINKDEDIQLTSGPINGCIVGRGVHCDAFLLENDEFLKSNKNFSFVDAESYYFHRTCNEIKIGAKSIMVVTDIPNKINFFDVDEKYDKLIETGIEKLLRCLYDEISRNEYI